MTSRAWYNENDPFAAAWLRALIDKGLIAPGDVDERDIRDVRPDDLDGYRQCHFFAGIGVWSYALRRAGFADDREVWTGSCPCQPFSAAGEGRGFADERHLWPAFHHLIASRRPELVLGEQVASKDGLAWLDLVQADMEGSAYAIGAVDLCAAGVGAPHIRQRLWWAAHSTDAGRPRPGAGPATGRSGAGLVVDADHEGSQGRRVGGDGADQFVAWSPSVDGRLAGAEWQQRSGEQRQQSADGRACELAFANDAERRPDSASGDEFDGANAGRPQGAGDVEGRGGTVRPAGPVNGFWRNSDWLLCRDGKWRPVEPGTFPLAHGTPARVGRLRGYGNAINAEAATLFIQAVEAERRERSFGLNVEN